MSWWIGGTVAVALGLILLPYGNIAWRYMLAAGAIPAIVVLILRRRVEETPRFAVEHNNKEEIDDIKNKLGIKDDEIVNDSSNETVENANYLKRAIFTFTAWFLNDLISMV